MKNKIIIIIIFILAFTGSLTGHLILDHFSLNAQLMEKKNQKNSLYEENFKKLKLITTDKKEIILSEVKEHFIILNFWASWCLPCLQEFPSLVELQEKYKSKLKVIGINGDTEDVVNNIKKIEKKYKLNFPSTTDIDEVFANQFKVNTYPFSIVFSKGKVIFVSEKKHNFMDKDFVKLLH